MARGLGGAHWRLGRRLGLLALAAVTVGVLVASAIAGPTNSSRPAGTATARANCPMNEQVSYNNINASLPILPASCYYQAVPRAKCGPGSKPETGFQGEVPLSVRDKGFKGFSCNLQLVGKWQGQGASWQLTWYGHCAYYDQALPPTSGTPLYHPGTVAVDVKNPAHPRPTAYLATPGLLHPWEDLKVNVKRGLLAGQLQGGAPLDVYSVANDCAHPKLLSSTPLADFGHEGEWTPDGMTYWATSLSDGAYHAVDMSEPTHPKEILNWKLPENTTHLSHGMAFSPDGKTAYFTVIGRDPNTENVADNGFIIADVSDIQLRRPNPQVRILSEVTFLDGGLAQMVIPFTENGHPYLEFTDELGGEPRSNATGGNAASADGWRKACQDGLPPFGTSRIFDISNPRHPVLVSRLTLQTDKPSNCQQAVKEEIQGAQNIFSYDTHYCSIDRRVNATALACGTFNSGIRVFDIRNPAKPKEIAYYNPPSAQQKIDYLRGSEHANFENLFGLGNNGLSADWCSAQSRFYKSGGAYYLWGTCQDNGFQVLRFTNHAYPLGKKAK